MTFAARRSPPLPLLIWGASGHAKVVADAASRSGAFCVLGFIDDLSPERAGMPWGGLTILGGTARLQQAHADGVRHIAVAIGDNAARLRVGEQARQAGFTLVTVIHPNAVIAESTTLGSGSFVAAGAVVNPDTFFSDLVIINTGATIDHDCRLDEGVHISPGAHVAGRVTIGARTWIGVGASIRDGVTIGADTIVGAGAAVVRNLPDGIVAFGVPARIHRVSRDH